MSKGSGRGRKKTVRNKASRRRAKKTEEGDKYHMWGRRRNGLTDNFTLAVYMQFLVAADTDRLCAMQGGKLSANCCRTMTMTLYNKGRFPYEWLITPRRGHGA